MNFSIKGAALAALTLLLPVYAADLPGKAVFDESCKNCDGVEGKGDRMADKFYQMTIPRLNTEYVQKKTDDELKRIITKGVRKMEPARVGQPQATHKLKLTDEQVADVIAYVRTLKG